VLVVVLLGLLDLLGQTSRIAEKSLKLIQRDGLKEHTSELTPKGLILKHLHDASVDLLTNLLLLNDFRCSFGRARGSNRLRDGLLLRGGLNLDGHLRLLGLLHLSLGLLAGTALVLTVEGTSVLGLTREHLLTHVRVVHAGHLEHVHVGSEHLLTVHATHGRDHARIVLLELEHGATILLLHCVSNVERLAVEHMTVNLLDGLRSGLGGGKVAETKAPADAVGGHHDLAALDHTEVLEEVAEVLVSDRVSKVTDVQVGLGSRPVVKGTLVPLSILTLALLLGAIDVEGLDNKALLLEVILVLTLSKRANKDLILPLEDLLVKSLLCLDSILVLVKVDKAEATALTSGLILHDDRRGDLAKLREQLLKVRSVKLLADVLHIHVGVGLVGVVATEVLGDELLDNDVLTKALELVLVSLAGLESLLAVLGLLELDETIAKAGAIILGNNLA